MEIRFKYVYFRSSILLEFFEKKVLIFIKMSLSRTKAMIIITIIHSKILLPTRSEYDHKLTALPHDSISVLELGHGIRLYNQH